MTPATKISTREAAARLGFTEWVIRAAIERGELTAYRIGRVYRLDPADVDRWAASRVVVASAKPAVKG